MPGWELFDRQPPAYCDEVLPPTVRARVAVEKASAIAWDRLAVVGMQTFGASAPLNQLFVKLGFTPDQVAELARDRMAAARREQP
jgi:transketolase